MGILGFREAGLALPPEMPPPTLRDLEARSVRADHLRIGATAFGRIGLAAVTIAVQAGCTSPLTTVALREFLRESTMSLAIDSDAEEASKPKVDPNGSASKSGDRKADAAGDEPAAEDAAEEISTERRIERSLERLARTSGFDQAASDVVAATLEKAAPEDWPDIIDSFAASLEASPPRSSPSSAKPAGVVGRSPQQFAKRSGGLTSPVSLATDANPTDAKPTDAEEEAAKDEAAKREATKTAAAGELQPSEPPRPEDPAEFVARLKERLAEARRTAPLAVRRACFASKVRGWGNLDAFDEPRFVPGQDVLVYFELDNLDGIESPRGFCTRVETSLRLVDANGDVVEEWGFPIVEDRSDSPRTDYFVRYVVRLPADATSGSHRLEAAIVDAVSSKTVATSLPLEVVSPKTFPAR